MISVAELKKGNYAIYKDEPHLISGIEFVNPGKGSAFYRVKLKSLKSGRVVENTFKSNESIEEYGVDTRELQYLYKDTEEAYFMNPHTFDQVTIKLGLIEDFAHFLQDGLIYQVLLHGDDAIGLRPPKRVIFKIAHTEK
ncbi:MAG: elongation factor P, partial [bacterium]|nr:elongation factor P [bacterium]